MNALFQPPGLVLSLLLASAIALAFYLWQGRHPRDLLLFWLASAAGFACGQLAGQALGVVPWTIGEVHVIEATALAILFLLALNWLRPRGKTT